MDTVNDAETDEGMEAKQWAIGQQTSGTECIALRVSVTIAQR